MTTRVRSIPFGVSRTTFSSRIRRPRRTRRG
ncbi:MAG TPA: hypothetical protein DCG06_14690 [Deltaproteobacteria bacterium]|nr:hypothetical protein [Deltaproteobacteria bacterium]